jgi:hypothetical protein
LVRRILHPLILVIYFQIYKGDKCTLQEKGCRPGPHSASASLDVITDLKMTGKMKAGEKLITLRHALDSSLISSKHNGSKLRPMRF